MQFSNRQVRDSLISMNVIRMDKDEEGNDKPRVFPAALRALDYALFKTHKYFFADYSDTEKRISEERQKGLKAIKVDSGAKDDKGEPIFEDVQRWKSIKAKQDFAAFESAELDEMTDVQIHKVMDKELAKACRGEVSEKYEIPDALFPALFELDFLFTEGVDGTD